jgi:hypothetical protein
MSDKYIINDDVWSDTDLVSPVAIEAPEIEFIFDRYRFRRIKQKYAQRLDYYRRAILGSRNLKYNNAILVSESVPTNLNGSVVTFIREYIEVPTVTEEIVPISYTYPSLWSPNRYREELKDDGDYELKEIKYNLKRPPLTTNTSAKIVFTYFTVTPDTQTSINREDDLTEFLKVDTFKKWPIASNGTFRGISGYSADYIDSTTVPNFSGYLNAASTNGDKYSFRAFDTVVEKWIANIYRKKDVFIQAR